MGVQGLWQLLESTGRPVTLESLEGKILAIDVSIWLHQAMRGMRDDQGNVSPNAHLLVLFNRICKLLFYRIKPIFVFDGGVPHLKKQTMVARRQRREMAASKSKKTSDNMLKNYMRTHALHAVTAKGKQKKPTSVPKLGRFGANEPDMFDLPPMPESSETSQEEEEEDASDIWAMKQEHLAEYAPDEDVDKMDIDSEMFRALPLEIQHELITEMKEKGKKSSWKKLDKLPKQAGEFSNYQLNKLLSKGKMTQRLDKLRKEMTARNAGAVASILDMDSAQELLAGRVMSEDMEHYVLLKSKMLGKNDEGETSKDESDKKNAGEISEHKSQENLDKEAKGHKEPDVKKSDDSSCVDLTHEGQSSTPSDKRKEISEAVKSFFAKHELDIKESAIDQKLDSEGQNVSKVNEVVTVSDNDVSVSPGDIEVVTVNDEKKDTNMQLLLTSAVDKLIHGALGNKDRTDVKNGTTHKKVESSKSTDITNVKDATSREKEESSIQVKVESANEDDIMIVGEVAAHGGPSQKARSAKKEPPKTSMAPFMSTLLDKLVHSALSENRDLEEEEESDDPSSDSDAEFVEVSWDPNKKPKEDELFPLETFEPSVTLVCSSPEEEVPPSKKPEEDLMVVDKDDIKNTKEDGVPAVVVSDHEQEKGEKEKENYVTEQDKETESDVEMEKEPDFRSEEDENKEQKEHDQDSDDDESVEEEDDAEDDGEVAMETNDQDDDSIMEKAQTQEAVNEWAGIDVADPFRVQEDLESERLVLATERRKQERVAVSISDVMYSESKELLQLFGLPFIVSPQEAEAQCAYLDHTDQTQGTITDDSDIWLFGGQYVYKNFFSKGKDVEFFRSGDFEQQLVLSREKLIQLAYLLGSDYTEGIQGVGWVTAMEVLGEFSGETLEGLKKLKDWWDKVHKQLMPQAESVLKSKLRKLTIHNGFPNPLVRDAYLQPVVDESKEKFSWGSPDLDLLRDFATEKFGWNRTKIDEMLLPVLRKLNEKQVQSKINQFFPMEHSQPKGIKSKRLQRALNILGNQNTENGDCAEELKKPTGRKQSLHKRKAINDVKEDTEVKGQIKKKKGQRSKVTKVNKTTDSDDASEEYLPSENVPGQVKGQTTRRSGRVSTKVIATDEGNSNEDDESIPMELSKQSTKESKSQGTGLNRTGKAKAQARGRGRGKGRVGVREKGKSLAKKGRGQNQAGRRGVNTTGPQLSESSSESE